MKPDEVKVPGWYWAMQEKRYCDEWVIVRVGNWLSDGRLWAQDIGSSGEYPLTLFLEFIGPLTPGAVCGYRYRIESDGQAVELGFATHEELMRYIERHDPAPQIVPNPEGG